MQDYSDNPALLTITLLQNVTALRATVLPGVSHSLNVILGSGSFPQDKLVEHVVDWTKRMIFKTDLHLLLAVSQVNLDKQTSWFWTVKSPLAEVDIDT